LEVGTGFHGELSGRENIYLSGAIMGMSKAEIDRKFDEIVAFAEVEKLIDTPVKHYSSGMYVRLAFAVAAHLEPEILLVDEVLAVGDAAFQKKCLGKMGDVAKEGRTVLFVSHNMQAVNGLCSNGILLEQGHAVRQDTIAKVIEIYLNRNLRFNSEVCWSHQDEESELEFNFCAVRIRTKNYNLASLIPLSEGFIVELEYEILRPLEDANIAVILNNSYGECVLTSTDVDMNPKSISSRREPGRYLASLHVPSEYLRPGIYHIDLGASVTNRKMLGYVSQAISLEIIDDGSVEMCIGQGRRGVVAPRLPWHVLYQPITDPICRPKNALT
jgi:lipopolysaccharide transport system ATP-binding protein